MRSVAEDSSPKGCASPTKRLVDVPDYKGLVDNYFLLIYLLIEFIEINDLMDC